MSRRSIRPRLLGRTALGFASSLAALATASTARAQIDVAPPLPNVLLLVDTSGSMEFKTDGTPVTCNPGNPLLTNERNRWTNVVEVLTGTLQDFSCESIDRVSNAFKTGEYQLVSGTAPYDWRYPIPYHRPLSGALGCVAGPGTLPGTSPTNPFMWPLTNAVSYHRYSDTSFGCGMSQAPDGILDEFRSRVRFGLMTFDTEVNASTGYAPAPGNYTSANADTPGGQAGLYSYVVGAAATGKPMGCATPSIAQEVGARNGAAPAWEGRMINFGNPNDSENAYQTKGDHIQEVLLATRPFGATPIAGMLRDAEDFLWNDTSDDPDVFPPGTPNPFDDYGPGADPYVRCPLVPRDQVVILLTDGEPNMDLRPFCSDTPVGGLPAGACPFERPEDVTYRLAHPSSGARTAIKTFVVGFALELVDADLNASTPNVSCSTLVDPPPPAPGPRTLSAACSAPGVANNVPLQACCTLQRIAIAGDGDAYFASTASDLRSAISDILARSIPTTSRTQPAVSAGGAATGGSYRFFSGFEVGRESLWRGKLRRQRWECDKDPPERPINEALGDDFVVNVNDAGPANRRFYTVVGKNGAGDVIRGTETARTNIGSVDVDGAGIATTEVHTGTASAFASAVPADAMAIPVAARPVGVTSDNQARTFFLEWLVGVNATTARRHRCPSSTNCNLIGDIHHSTPQVAGAPSALLRDESYERFTLENKLRPIVLYTSTNDGFLHAFKVASNDKADVGDTVKTVMTKTNNELWSFAPPGVLPNLHALYPYNHQNLLDGTATIRDVVAIEKPTPSDPPTVFERTGNDARAGAGTWRSVLVQGFGSDHAGYFALDVTTPVPGSDPTDTDQGGPRFLWQLTKDVDGNPLFGRGGATPVITTLFFDPAGGTNAREIPVAVLPGGPGGTRVTGGSGCPVAPRTFPGVTLDSRFTPRGKVNCYDYGSGDAERGARSLTIVRLDTGEIIRTFRQNLTDVANATLRTRVTLAEIDSPITGQPAAFPGQTGSVADRIIVGDQDGRLWKVNVSSMNPASWTMKLFFDLYPASIEATAAHTFDDGQPIELAPVLSIDENGNMTVNAATGDQDALGLAPGQDHYVYSFTDDFDLTRTTGRTKVNWLLPFADGTHVLGPLNLFNQFLYFATSGRLPSAPVCENGTTTVYGMDYVRLFDPADPDEFKKGGTPAIDDDQVIQTINNSVSVGLSIVQQPACYTAAPDPLGDDLVGFRGLTRFTAVTPGKFQLIMHESSQNPAPNQPVTTRTIDLPTQKSESRIASWASIIE